MFWTFSLLKKNARVNQVPFNADTKITTQVDIFDFYSYIIV